MQIYKVYKKGNYNYFEWTDAAGRNHKKRYASLRLTYLKGETTFDIFYHSETKIASCVHNIEFTSSLDESGAVLSEVNLQKFLDETTSPSGGSATSANQELQTAELIAINTKLSADKLVQDNILLELKKSKDFEEHWVYDKTNITKFYKVRSILNQTTGLIDTSILNLDDSVPSPLPSVDNLVQASASKDYEFNTIERIAVTAGIGYAVGARIQEIQIIDVSNGTLVNTIWVNKTTDLVIASPVFSHLIFDDTYSAKLEEIKNLLTPIARVTTISSHTAATTIVQPFYKVSITMTDSGTINGVAIPAGFTWNLDDKITTNIAVTGTNFIIIKLV